MFRFRFDTIFFKYDEKKTQKILTEKIYCQEKVNDKSM